MFFFVFVNIWRCEFSLYFCFLLWFEIYLVKSFIPCIFDMFQKTVSPNLDEIEKKISSASTLKDSTDVIAETKNQIFQILQNEIAEESSDETLLKNLRDKLNVKKDLFEKDLGK